MRILYVKLNKVIIIMYLLISLRFRTRPKQVINIMRLKDKR